MEKASNRSACALKSLQAMQVAYTCIYTLRTHGRFYCYLDLGLPRAFLLGNGDGRIMYSAVLLHQDKGLILGKLVFLQADR
jgi:hypothetical protein